MSDENGKGGFGEMMRKRDTEWASGSGESGGTVSGCGDEVRVVGVHFPGGGDAGAGDGASWHSEKAELKRQLNEARAIRDEKIHEQAVQILDLRADLTRVERELENMSSDIRSLERRLDRQDGRD